MPSRDVALGYVRQSVVFRNDRTDSIEGQRDAIAATAEHHGWPVEYYQDADELVHSSGLSDRRPGFRALMARVRAGGVVAVIVRDYARLSRSLYDSLRVIRELDERGVHLVSIRQQIDTTTAAGRFHLNIILSANQLEAEQTAERMRWMIEHRRARGLHWGAVAFGYDRHDGQLTPNEHAPTVRQIFELYATGAWSYRSLADYLNREGYAFARAGRRLPWTWHRVHRLIDRHWVYRGWSVPKDYIADTLPEGAHRGAWPPLVEEDIARACLRVRAEHDRGTSPRPSPYTYLLTPLVYCGHCGAKLGTKQRPRRYADGRACVDRYYTHRERSCGLAYSFSAPAVEALVLEYVNALRWPVDWHATYRAYYSTQAAPDHSARLARLRAELTRLTEMARRLFIDLDEYERLRAPLLRDIDALTAAAQPSNTVQLADIGQHLQQQFADPASRPGLRAALSLLFARIDLYREPDGVRIASTLRPEFEVLLSG